GSGGQIGFAARNLKFKSPQAALSFYRTVNSIESDSSILSFWLRNKSRTLKKAVALSHLGNNPKETIERTIRKTFRGSADAKINLEVDRAVKEFNVKFDVYSGVSVIKSPAIRSVARGLSQILSLTTLSTARATVRNFFDFGGHALAFGNTLYDASSSIGGYANDTLRSLGFLGAHGAASLVKSGAKVRAQVDGILDILGYANAFDGLSKAGLLSVENVFDRPGGSGNRFLNSLFTANDSLYKLSGNSSLTDFRRVRKGITLQQTWNNILERGDYKTFVASLPEREAKQLNYLNAKFGIDEDVFNFLRKVNKITPEDQPELLKGFGFGKFPSFINRDSILETGDDIARQFKRQEETAEAFKSRVGNAWQRMIYEYIHHSVPTVRLGDSVTPYASDLPDIAVLLLLPGFKFADITNAQWQDGVRTARVALYGAEGVSEFNNVGGAVKSFGKYSKAAGIYGGIFAGIVWTKDILNNRKPTDFTNEENVGRLMLTSGFLGLYTFGASNLLNAFHSQKRGIYTGTPLASAIDKAEKLGRAVTGLSKPNQNGGQLYNTIKSIHNSQGLTNLWYLKGVVDYTIYNSLLSPSEQNRENRTDRYYDREKLFQ
ncbi:MAG: hypothetical protein HAW67_00545, partial [Endozoicomonadaceae bacterium]|nr:hypothetical protein [Endozoicomonadaceae bacterium]